MTTILVGIGGTVVVALLVVGLVQGAMLKGKGKSHEPGETTQLRHARWKRFVPNVGGPSPAISGGSSWLLAGWIAVIIAASGP